MSLPRLLTFVADFDLTLDNKCLKILIDDFSNFKNLNEYSKMWCNRTLSERVTEVSNKVVELLNSIM